MPDIKYKEYEIQMSPGSALFLYTDGLTEATSSASEMFGTERITEVLNTEPDAVPRELIGKMHAAVSDFVREAEQFDDLTMMCVRYK